MDDPFARLSKVLVLERRQGHRNKAVIGGLDKFVSRWESDARSATENQTAVTEIVALLLGYAAVEDAVARDRIIDQVLRRAQEAAPGGEAGAALETLPAGHPGPWASPGEPRRDPTTSEQARPEARVEQTSPEAVQRPAETPANHEPFLPTATKPTTPHAQKPSQVLPERQPSPSVRMPPAQGVRAGQGGADGSVPASADQRADARLDQGSGSIEALQVAPDGPQESRQRRQAARPDLPGGLDAPVTRLPGVGPAYAERLARLGVETVRDLLYLLPVRHEDFSRLRTIDRLRYGDDVTVIGTVWQLESRTIGAERRIVTATVGDGTGELRTTWFNPYVERRLKVGQAFSFAGKVDIYRNRLLMRNPSFEPLERGLLSTGRLVPVFPLTEGLTQEWLRKLLRVVVDGFAEEVPDALPESLRQELGLAPLAQALQQVHFPDNPQLLEAARQRLSFDEYLALQLGVQRLRSEYRASQAPRLALTEEAQTLLLECVGFPLTGAQQRAWAEIREDMTGARPMTRLLQGDVGSGKTVVAGLALWAAVASDRQAVLLAPTEILAEQHARTLGRWLEGLRHPHRDRAVRVALFTGALKEAERGALLQEMATGTVDVVVGTHALLQPGIALGNLGLVVVDEQHRFGVEQRGMLVGTAGETSGRPHLLVMSATPIPRSLALTIYGDLDVSIIDELPAGRIPVRTKWLLPAQRERAYGFLRREIAAGRQGFIIYPLVEGDGGSESEAAVTEHERLQRDVFPECTLGLLHGRMKPAAKDAVMREFAEGGLDLLVATSVVEVGVDVPNATVMLVEGAERFGLAQLHQFRGRVGRGLAQAYCIMISAAAEGDDGARRLMAMEATTDGFALAQTDLEMRGPGDFFGTRQSGLPRLHAAQLGDLATLEAARSAARRIYDVDPHLTLPEHATLAAVVAALWEGAGEFN